MTDKTLNFDPKKKIEVFEGCQDSIKKEFQVIIEKIEEGAYNCEQLASAIDRMYIQTDIMIHNSELNFKSRNKLYKERQHYMAIIFCLIAFPIPLEDENKNGNYI